MGNRDLFDFLLMIMEAPVCFALVSLLMSIFWGLPFNWRPD